MMHLFNLFKKHGNQSLMRMYGAFEELAIATVQRLPFYRMLQTPCLCQSSLFPAVRTTDCSMNLISKN